MWSGIKSIISHKSFASCSINKIVISKTLFVIFIQHSEGAVIVVVVVRYRYTSCVIDR